jgi:arylsulfatase A
MRPISRPEEKLARGMVPSSKRHMPRRLILPFIATLLVLSAELHAAPYRTSLQMPRRTAQVANDSGLKTDGRRLPNGHVTPVRHAPVHPRAEPVLDKTTTRSAPSPRSPNILLILADDLGYGDLRCYNTEAKVPTPNIDRLASEGMRFTDAHSPATVCTPSRYSLLTGQMAFRVPNGGTVFTGAGGPSLIAKGRLTLPALLRPQGYATAVIGKWHVGLTFRDAAGKPIHQGGIEAVRRIDFARAVEGGPLDHGFDRFFGTSCCPTTDWLYAFIDGDRIPVAPTRLLDRSTLPVHPYANDCREGLIAPDFPMEEVDMLFLQKSREFIAQQAGRSPRQPFFLLHSTQAVHLPSFAGKNFRGRTQAGPHGDFLFEFDHIVGELMRELDIHGLAENTLVVLTSDNGPETTSVARMRADHAHDGARPWRGVKRDAWEGGHRVPFIVRWPSRVQPGTTTDQLASLTDLMATIAAVTGAELPHEAAEDSFNLLPALEGKAAASIRPYLLTQAFGGARTLSIRRGQWKYIDHRGSGGNNYATAELQRFALPETAPQASGQLYDLANDPSETTNLFEQRPDIVKELQTLLQHSKTTGRSRP